jgi:hypothetical protein
MKRTLGLCLLLMSWLAVASSEEFFDGYNCCEWKNLAELETGYRSDHIHFKGPMRSGSVNSFKKNIEARLWQINLQDRLTWNDRVFLQTFGGFGYAFRAADKAHISVPVYSENDLTFDVAEPYDNMGAASIDTQRGQVSIPREISSSSHEVYNHKRHGHAWSFDIALGTTFSWCNVCYIEKIALEPRIGFTYEWLKVRESFRTRLDGGYIGLSLPFSFCNFFVFPDIAYVFAGQRSEHLEIWNAADDTTESLSTRRGNVTGVKACVALNYEILCNLFVGFDWRFFYLRTNGGKYELLEDGVFWKPKTQWTSNQFLGTISYNF